MDVPSNLSLAYLEELYEQYLQDASSLAPEWQEYFGSIEGDSALAQRGGLEPTLPRYSIFNPPGGGGNGAGGAIGNINLAQIERVAALQDRVDQLIRAYRVRGHMVADLDPLDRPRQHMPELDPEFYEFDESDLTKTFSARTLSGGKSRSLREILDHMKETYCRSIGVQFMHIDDLKVKNWLQEKMEATQNHIELDADDQKRILTKLTRATLFEEFIQKSYLGAKSFSLEGAESVIPLLDMAIEIGGAQGLNEIVVGMAHRGRLNVLANIMGKSLRDIFHEFEDAEAERYVGRGDVKYHLGYSSDIKTLSGQRVHLSLCFNPSHLEIVNTVVQGRIRAKQDLEGDTERKHKLAVLIHGDAAFAGEGIVQETLNMSELKGYHIGGTLHVVINNQIGFTTEPQDSRSSTYCTDVAKMLQIPIFHVNGEDPEAVAQTISLAMEFRQEFQKDVIIDMYAFRRRGHNEGDEPMFTNTSMYHSIRKRETVRESFVKRLLKLGTITQEEADQIAEECRILMEEDLNFARQKFVSKPTITLQGKWVGYFGGRERMEHEVPTAINKDRLQELLKAMCHLPEGFNPHRKISRFLKQREEMATGERPLDWGAGEALAFVSLLTEGKQVRITGQDAERGTFSHRHSVVHDMKTNELYYPFNNVADGQAKYEVHNSPLCEAGVLGYEYGYSLDVPDGLTIWEAQFGDFANCAQMIVDQFIVSAEEKWKRMSGLTMLLPHGFEGMGPEHSSARLERYLQMAVNDCIQVCNLTTPAQIFHVLRRQVLRKWRKPLIIMSPKSLLRHPQATSTLDDLAKGEFQRIIPDGEYSSGDVERLILCCGKVYYDLMDRRSKLPNPEKFPILRIEQLHPLPEEQLKAALEPYKEGTPLFFVQEEPENMGPWTYMLFNFGRNVAGKFPMEHIARARAATPATGSKASHVLEHKRLMNRAFGLPEETEA